MKGSPTPSEESPLAPNVEAPPSYDYAAGLSSDDVSISVAGPGPSTSASAAGVATTRSVPKNNLHLFSGPPNAEPLYASLQTNLGLLEAIGTTKSGYKTDTWDSRLNDRT